ncbi:MFS transporter [Ahrensia sp. R2A130]|uniref:MFS transporter n=1 Tax=Ahrensia sp. R2A130 TaxID=744979 RepID=UPI0001E083B8|nr:MFS transporter [Ahrensia sp. R2A130]EFL90524.1 major facilitator transporter [Ahrensia sp. R2A130]
MSSEPTGAPQAQIDIDPNASAKRNALLLSLAQAVCGSAAPISIALGGLAGLYLLGADKSLATAPVTGYNLGVALMALPAAMFMARVGRRLGFMFGSVIGICGSLLCSYALIQADFWMFCIGMAMSGGGSSFVQQFRFAAADQGTPDFKPKAISWVLAGGIFAAIIGPQTAIYFRDFFAPIEFAGAYFAGAFLWLAGVFVLSMLRFERPATKAERAGADKGRPLMEIMAQPRFMVSVLCATGSYALMSFVMTGAPLAMAMCGFSPDDSTWGIQWHVMAMFGPSFFTGNLIARYGKEKIVAIGMALLIACALVGLSGITLGNFYIALILLGVGWNFGFIGATAMLTDCYEPSEKSKAQGANDFILFGFVAFGSFMSGQTLNTFGEGGWDAINMVVFPVVALCLGSLGWLALKTRRATAS